VFQLYPRCERIACSTCVLDSRKTEKSTSERGRTFVPTCVPNLPNDLACPVCNVSDRRTLILTEMTYRCADEASAREQFLTFTPAGWDHASAHDNSENSSTEGNDETDNDTPSSTSLSCAHHTTNFPPLHDQAFISGDRICLRGYKHGIAIHCSNCFQFATFTPARRCPRYDCRCFRMLDNALSGREKSRKSGGIPKVLGVLTRVRCRGRRRIDDDESSSENSSLESEECMGAVSCHQCNLETWGGYNPRRCTSHLYG
jgi:hypothetical protein